MADWAPRARAMEACGWISRRRRTWFYVHVCVCVGGGGELRERERKCVWCNYKARKQRRKQVETQARKQRIKQAKQASKEASKQARERKSGLSNPLTDLAARDADELGHDPGQAEGHGVADVEFQAVELVEAERLEAPADGIRGWGWGGWCEGGRKGRTHE